MNDARSYNGTMKDSDHRIVLAKINIDWHKKTHSVIKTHQIIREKLRDMEIRKKT